jgi:hypothetical protein
MRQNICTELRRTRLRYLMIVSRTRSQLHRHRLCGTCAVLPCLLSPISLMPTTEGEIPKRLRNGMKRETRPVVCDSPNVTAESSKLERRKK